MTKRSYVSQKRITQFKPVLTPRQYRNALDNNIGFCVACGSTKDGCEPDARQYTCDKCGLPKVYGIPELLVMDLCIIK